MNEQYSIDDARNIFFEDHEDFGPTVHGEIVRSRRWGHDEIRIFKNEKTGQHWAVNMYIMSGDEGDHQPNKEPYKVCQKEVTKIEWVEGEEPKVSEDIETIAVMATALSRAFCAIAMEIETGKPVYSLGERVYYHINPDLLKDHPDILERYTKELGDVTNIKEASDYISCEMQFWPKKGKPNLPVEEITNLEDISKTWSIWDPVTPEIVQAAMEEVRTVLKEVDQQQDVQEPELFERLTAKELEKVEPPDMEAIDAALEAGRKERYGE